jgi:hypothetical protein
MGLSGQRHALATVYPRGKDPRCPFTGGWVGPRDCLDTEARGKILCFYRGSILARMINSPASYLKFLGSSFGPETDYRD